MPRIWDESGRETDFSVRLRGVAFWALLTADLIAEALWLNARYDGGDWPWKPILSITLFNFPFALLVFSAASVDDRFRSALKCTAQAAVLLLGLAWIAHGADPDWAWIGATILSASVAVGLLRSGRQVRAEEAAQRSRQDDGPA
ncbi:MULTISPECIES: hypothetical protein [unclassified Streptomyces]|uniref:hypothetical protein n=1 Tax=unclassified Streptomyces TaxID=2593676 RepID=UPI003254B6B5